MEKGLHQGDPLSSFLFIIVVETLCVAILEASNYGLYNGIELDASGLRIRLHKNKLYGVGVGSLEVDRMDRIVSCSSGCLPFVYLGLPVGKSMRNASA
ncbi:hypothetical protein Tco_1530883 [Tanacetum coccineum]